MFQFCKNGGPFLLVNQLLRVFLKGGGHGIVILRFEKYQVSILAFYLKRGKVDAVLPGDPCEGTDVFVSDFYALHPTVLCGKFLDRHFSMGVFFFVMVFHLGKKFAQRFSQFLLR